MRKAGICLGSVFVLILVVAAPGFQHGVPVPAGSNADRQLEPPQEIILNVIADDRQGLPVADLSRDDFQVFEDGRQQLVSSFECHEGGPQPVLILLDVLNTYFGARGRAQEEVVTALQRLKATESVYLYVLAVDGAVQAVHGMPDAAQMQTDVTPWTRDVRAMLDQAPGNALRPPSLAYANTRAEATFTALRNLAAHLAEASGRKAIVWVSHGVPTRASSATGSSYDFEPRLQRFAAVFGQAEIAIYAVVQSAEGAVPNTESSMDSQATLEEFADLTGGRMYPSDHFEEAISQALADTRLSYRLGYHAPPGKAGGAYRKVRVVCKRSGVRVRSRQGYYLPASVAARP